MARKGGNALIKVEKVSLDVITMRILHVEINFYWVDGRLIDSRTSERQVLDGGALDLPKDLLTQARRQAIAIFKRVRDNNLKRQQPGLLI